MKNITIHGMSNLKIRHFDMVRDLPKAVLRFNVTVPFLRFTANYDVDGRVLLVPVRGNGDGEGNFTQIFASGSIFGEKVSRNGKNYMMVTDMKWTIDITGDSHVQINNLFGGDKVLGQATNKIFNENWKDIFVAYRGVVEETFSVIFRDLCNKVFNHFTFEELYPE
ncbi:hypothetical protein C0J52_08560 [Blattella germanica]|nr:hypothetical protein C0J52_08560 [Blattella germanica]